MTRAVFLMLTQLGLYNLIKNNVLVWEFSFDGKTGDMHLCASATASVPKTTATNPTNVVKTRVMNDPHGAVGGPQAHFLHMLRKDGTMGFMRGWTASYLRTRQHTVLSLVFIKKVRQSIGLASY